MKVFLFQALIVHFLVNLYVFVKVWKLLPSQKKYQIPYVLLFVLELAYYLIGVIFNNSLPTPIFKTILLTGTTWMLFVGYIAAFLLLYDLVNYFSRWSSQIKKLNLTNLLTKRIYTSTAVCIVIAVMIYGNYRFWHPTITELDLKIEKQVEGKKTLKVVAVSDIHAGALIDKKILNMYVDKIMQQKPDLILLVGDIIDYDLQTLIDQKMEEEFRRLQAPYGVYVSTGNHEYRLNAEEKIEWLTTQSGMTMLRDSVAVLENQVYVVGREDNLAPNRKSLKEIIKDLDPQKPTIVLNHQPKNLQEEADNQIDLALYGHTHNGQLFPNNVLVNLLYEVGHGYKRKDNTHVYVSSGLGLAGPQYRIGTISEIVILNLHFN